MRKTRTPEKRRNEKPDLTDRTLRPSGQGSTRIVLGPVDRFRNGPATNLRPFAYGHFRERAPRGTTDETTSFVRQEARMRRVPVALLILLAFIASLAPSAVGASPGVVLSQVYAGGGNAGATYTNDFVELFN